MPSISPEQTLYMVLTSNARGERHEWLRTQTLYLADIPHSPSAISLAPAGRVARARGTRQRPLPVDQYPALLLSYVYAGPFLSDQHHYTYRHWALDSGAFSAHTRGTVIQLEQYAQFAKDQLARDPTLKEVFSLDVIGDWRASVSNTERLWACGVEAVPCFHAGEPWELLVGLCRDYPKVALGGAVGLSPTKKAQFYDQCFARVWPKALHGFGVSGRAMLMRFPFHSVDATNWEQGPCKFGNWRTFGRLSVRGSTHDLRTEIRHYLRLEALMRHRWGPAMATLAAVASSLSARPRLPAQPATPIP